MLGKIVVEGEWKITGMRVLDEKRMEISFDESGRILDVEFSSIATVTSEGRPDGSLYGEGHAILTTKDGDIVTWKGMGIGHNTGKGMASSWRGAKAFQTSSLGNNQQPTQHQSPVSRPQKLAAPNHPPVAKAGQDKIVNTGEIVAIDGSFSTDPDKNDTLSFLWEQTSPSKLSVNLTNSDESIASFVAPAISGISKNGLLEFKFKLTVRDDKGGIATDSINALVRDDVKAANLNQNQSGQREQGQIQGPIGNSARDRTGMSSPLTNRSSDQDKYTYF